MNAKIKLTLTGLTMVLLAATVLPVNAHSMKQTAHWSGPMYPLNESGAPMFDCPIKGSHASYENFSTGVAFTVRARDVERDVVIDDEGNCTPVDKREPGNAYTVWIMAFNHPEFCRGGETADGLRCSRGDHLSPATGFSIMYGTGAWAEGNALNLRGFREANSLLNVPEDVALGAGLVNPEGAEIHLRIRDHGPAQEGVEDDQISSFRGGCTEDTAPAFFAPREDAAYGDYRCGDIQATAS